MAGEGGPVFKPQTKSKKKSEHFPLLQVVQSRNSFKVELFLPSLLSSPRGLSLPPDCAISFPHFQKQHSLHPTLRMTVLENDSDLADWSDVNALSNPSPEAPLGCICSWKAESYALWGRKYFEIHVKSWKRERWVLEPTNPSLFWGETALAVSTGGRFIKSGVWSMLES